MTINRPYPPPPEAPYEQHQAYAAKYREIPPRCACGKKCHLQDFDRCFVWCCVRGKCGVTINERKSSEMRRRYNRQLERTQWWADAAVHWRYRVEGMGILLAFVLSILGIMEILK